jgi:2-polyprenyl-3-methyl-5-hydroxy-6-metoxy-1,4-benzoquinol methylase
MEDSKVATQHLAQAYADQGNPDGWFEEFYARAEGDIHAVYWADLKPNPFLLSWMENHGISVGKRAIAVGCGLGDDAEALANSGYQVTAFDISPSAIAMCLDRFSNSSVDYRVADLFSLPAAWHQTFDMVYECNTIQILTGANRLRAIRAITDLVALGGYVLVSCRSRKTGEQTNAFPLALDRYEIDEFARRGLSEIRFIVYDDDQDPPVPHFFAVYKRR